MPVVWLSLADGPAFLLVEAAQALFHRLGAREDLESMLGDLPWDARHIRGSPRKDVFVGAEEVDERAFLFGGERGPDADFSALGATGIQEDLPRAFYRFERSGRLLCVGCPFNDLLPEGGKLFGCDDCGCVSAAFDLALVSALEGGAYGDDPVGARHL